MLGDLMKFKKKKVWVSLTVTQHKRNDLEKKEVLVVYE